MGADREAQTEMLPGSVWQPSTAPLPVLSLWERFIRRLSTNSNCVTEIARWKSKFKLLGCLSSFVSIWLLMTWMHTQNHSRGRWSNMSWNWRTASWDLRVLSAVTEGILGGDGNTINSTAEAQHPFICADATVCGTRTLEKGGRVFKKKYIWRTLYAASWDPGM